MAPMQQSPTPTEVARTVKEAARHRAAVRAEPLLDAEAAGALFRKSAWSMRAWAREGKGPTHIRIDGRLYWALDDIYAYIDEHRHTNAHADSHTATKPHSDTHFYSHAHIRVPHRAGLGGFGRDRSDPRRRRRLGFRRRTLCRVHVRIQQSGAWRHQRLYRCIRP